jgi:uncharacterized protein YoxC
METLPMQVLRVALALCVFVVSLSQIIRAQPVPDDRVEQRLAAVETQVDRIPVIEERQAHMLSKIEDISTQMRYLFIVILAAAFPGLIDSLNRLKRPPAAP